MAANPKPGNFAIFFDGQSPIVDADADGPKRADFFEVQRRVAGVLL
jgi:hypothetical protein